MTAALDAVESTFAERLARGAAFDRVDLTLAALLGPLLRAPRPLAWRGLDEGSRLDELAALPAGAAYQRAAWAWREHRDPRDEARLYGATSHAERAGAAAA